ncbi:hypothetical protein DFR67_12658 [Williamsia limnetica]|uniref:Uncharacterized protein n=1 Tax=Williamsia limnetica TaxID=882452 RepID=A0A318RDS2_WILLI|nr:hypothetical protein [Williamsia limnetica]PYE12050.1 hypothetical protein DFR67_12658 [Williamsia limnetica]
MPQRSKGDRDHVTVRPPKVLGVKEIAEKAGYTTSQLVSDFLALALGHPELVEGPNRVKGQATSLPGMPTEQELRAALADILARQQQVDERQVAPAA